MDTKGCSLIHYANFWSSKTKSFKNTSNLCEINASINWINSYKIIIFIFFLNFFYYLLSIKKR